MIPSSKKDFQDMVVQVLGPLRSHYSKGKARLNLGVTGAMFNDSCAQLEAFGRALTGLAPFLCGGGKDQELEQIYVQGLQSGTDPDNTEYWGDSFEKFDQRFCEMVSISVALLLIPQKLWEPLPAKAKKNLFTWLEHINHYELPENNWQFFRIMTNAALQKLGGPYDAQAMATSLDCIDSLYIGDGWYRDGILMNTKDYYNSFAFHFFGLIYAAMMQEEDAMHCTIFKERAMQFGLQFIYFFDNTGEAVPFGRSLTLRFAQSAFWSACLFAGIAPIPVTVMKGILSRHLQKWMSAPIFDNGGVLSIGYKYPNLIMAEIYNAPGTALWALNAFLFLALDDNDPFWSTSPVAMPVLDTCKVLDQAEMILCRNSDSVTLYPAGSKIVANVLGHMTEKCGKFAYSSKYGLSVQKSFDSLENAAPDSTLVFQINGFVYARSAVISMEIHNDTLVSTWSPLPGIKVNSSIIPTPNGHIRRHTIQSNYECTAYDCGFALSAQDDGYRSETGGNSALVQNAQGYCRVSGGKGTIIKASPNTNIMQPRTAIPAVSFVVALGETTFETTIDFT
ncbi:MAG: DUF2264 domain-containing protein [Sphaerochaetaceae bacterium]